MIRERAKDFALDLAAVCSMVLIGAAIIGAFFTTQTFVTQYSVLSGRYSHYDVAGR